MPERLSGERGQLLGEPRGVFGESNGLPNVLCKPSEGQRLRETPSKLPTGKWGGIILGTAVEEDFKTRKGPSQPGGWLRGARHHGLPLLAVREIEGWGGRSAT